MKLTITLRNKLEQFNAALTSARDGLKRAGEILVEMLEEDPDVFDLILQQNPSLDLGLLISLERVGRGQDDYRLLIARGEAARRALSYGLPIAQQKALIELPIPVAVKNGDGEIKTVQKRMDELTRDETIRVIAPEGLRSPEEQAELIEQAEDAREEQKLKWAVHGTSITFHGNVTLGWRDLEKLLEQIRPKINASSVSEIKAEIERRQVTA